MANPETAMQLVSALAGAYVNVRLTPLTIEVFVTALADVPDDDLTRAVADWIAHEDDFPTIAALRRLALAERYPTEYEAWAEVKQAFGRYGRDRMPEWSSPLVGRAVDALGWRALCDSSTDNEPIDRAHFFKAYRALVDRDTFDRTSFSEALRRLQAQPQSQIE